MKVYRVVEDDGTVVAEYTEQEWKELVTDPMQWMNENRLFIKYLLIGMAALHVMDVINNGS